MESLWFAKAAVGVGVGAPGKGIEFCGIEIPRGCMRSTRLHLATWEPFQHLPEDRGTAGKPVSKWLVAWPSCQYFRALYIRRVVVVIQRRCLWARSSGAVEQLERSWVAMELNCLSVSTALCCTSGAFSVSWSFYTVGLLGRGISPSQVPLPAHRTSQTE
jgi:hypothetical protein